MKLCILLGDSVPRPSGYDCRAIALPVDDAGYRLIASADAVAASTPFSADVSYAIGLAHGLGKASIVDGGAAARPFRPRGPALDGVITGMDDAIRAYLEQNDIATVADLRRLKLDELASAPGVTRPALRAFLKELDRSERYPDPEALQQFLIKRGIFI